jgi:hypothetical protein
MLNESDDGKIGFYGSAKVETDRFENPRVASGEVAAHYSSEQKQRATRDFSDQTFSSASDEYGLSLRSSVPRGAKREEDMKMQKVRPDGDSSRACEPVAENVCQRIAIKASEETQ